MSKALQTFAMFLVPSALTLRHSSTLSSAASTAVYAAQWITASGFASVITFSQAAASVISISSTSTPIPSMPLAASSSITSCPSCPFTPVTRTLINDPSLLLCTLRVHLTIHVNGWRKFPSATVTCYLSFTYRRFPYILSK